MLISNFSSMEHSSSSVRYQDFCMKRPPVKAKLRNIVPTASSLLLGDTTVQEQVNKPKDTMAYTKGYPTEIYDMEEILPIISEENKIRDEFLRNSCNFRTSRRTENIFIREDENGVRSHYCPLDSELDGERDETEDYPDRPMQVDFDIEDTLLNSCKPEIPCLVTEKPSSSERDHPDRPMQFDFDIEDTLLNSCKLDSDDIPCLVAEKPSSSESEECEDSSDDSYMSTEYERLENHPITSEQFLQQNEITSSYKTLTGECTEKWAESSSDDSDKCVSYEKDSDLLQKCIEKSDTGEFEDDSDEKSANKNLKLPENKEDKDFTELSIDIKSSKVGVENKTSLESFIKLSSTENFESENTGRNGQLNMQDPDEKHEKNSESDSIAKYTHCGSSDSENESVSNQDSEDTSKKEKLDDDAENDTEGHLEVFEDKKDSAPEIADFSSKTRESHHDLSSDSITKNKANLNLEHISMNVSGPSKEDEIQTSTGELYSERMSLLESKEKREKSIMPEESHRIERQVLTDKPSLESPCNSAPFVPVSTEEQKVSSKSQNKLTKFFQSLKKKFERKKYV